VNVADEPCVELQSDGRPSRTAILEVMGDEALPVNGSFVEFEPLQVNVLNSHVSLYSTVADIARNITMLCVCVPDFHEIW
jgi:hypothetical protein